MQVFYCDNQINIEMIVTSVHQKVPEKESRVISKRIGFTDDIATFNRLAKLILFVNRNTFPTSIDKIQMSVFLCMKMGLE